MRKYLSSQEAKEAYAKIGMDSAPSSSQELRAKIITEPNLYGTAVKDAGLKIE